MPLAQTIRLLVAQLPVDPDLDDQQVLPLPRLAVVGLVALGGTLGTLARFAISEGLSPSPSGWPTATLLVNVLGSFGLGLLLTGIHEHAPHSRIARPLFGTGFCGGFTTFSTFAVEFTLLGRRAHPGLAVAYLLVSVAGCLLAAFTSVVLTRAVLRRWDRERWLRRISHGGRLASEEDRA